jgi:hypothetical protein
LPTGARQLTNDRRSAATPARRARQVESAFDYAAFPEHVQHYLKASAAAIHARLGARLTMRSAIDVVHVGSWLHDVRKHIGRSFFQPFLDAEFEWSQSAASKFMRSAAVFGHLDHDCLDRFRPTALYLLSTKHVPQSAREEAIALARAGRIVKRSVAEKIIYLCLGYTMEAIALLRLKKSLIKTVERIGDRPDNTALAIAEQMASGFMKQVKRWRLAAGKSRRESAKELGLPIPPLRKGGPGGSQACRNPVSAEIRRKSALAAPGAKYES